MEIIAIVFMIASAVSLIAPALQVADGLRKSRHRTLYIVCAVVLAVTATANAILFIRFVVRMIVN